MVVKSPLVFPLNHKPLLLELCLKACFMWSSECCYTNNTHKSEKKSNGLNENKDYCNKMIYVTSKERAWQATLNWIKFTFAIKEMSVLPNDTFNCLHLLQDNIPLNKGETFKHNEGISRADCRTKALLFLIGSLG